MDTVILKKLKELIETNQSLGIVVGKDPGIDEMGAALSFYLSLRDSGKSVSIVCPTEPIVEVSSLVGIDQVKTSFDSDAQGDLTVSFPYREGEIEKISYTLEDGFLNILVKAGEKGLSFEERDIKFTRGGGSREVIFAVGVPRISQIETLLDIESLKDTKIINIDNKAENQGYGDIVLVSKNSSSVSEQIALIMFSLGMKIDIDIAQNLLSGISNATDNFQKSNTSVLAFEMAANLMKRGAIRVKQSSKKPVTDDDPYSFFSQTPLQKPKEDRKREEDRNNNPPSDWLAPKIYKGSTSI